MIDKYIKDFEEKYDKNRGTFENIFNRHRNGEGLLNLFDEYFDNGRRKMMILYGVFLREKGGH